MENQYYRSMIINESLVVPCYTGILLKVLINLICIQVSNLSEGLLKFTKVQLQNKNETSFRLSLEQDNFTNLRDTRVKTTQT